LPGAVRHRSRAWSPQTAWTASLAADGIVPPRFFDSSEGWRHREAGLNGGHELREHSGVALRLAEDHDAASVIKEGEVELERLCGRLEQHSLLRKPEVRDRVDIGRELRQVLCVVPPALFGFRQQGPTAPELRP